MPNRKKCNARFPPARIKKIMRTDKEVGKVAAPVPAVISRALELFAERLLQQAGDVTISRGSRTLSPAHLKQCIFSERRFDFLRELVENVPDAVESEEVAGPTPSSVTVRPSAPTAHRSALRPAKYLKMEMPSPAASSTNGQPHSAPAAGRPPVPDLIHTSLLGLGGGALSAVAVSAGQPLCVRTVPTSAGPLAYPPAVYAGAAGVSVPSPSASQPQPPPAHRGSVPPPLAVRYGSLPEMEPSDLV